VSLIAGTRVGAYEVLSELGAGGMGVVYRARDTKLGREVALKTLPAEFASDPDRLARFEREARLLASLNHPNIATVHGLERLGDTQVLVLELVEGDTLADRLVHGAIPEEEAVTLALQLAAALEAAHENGVIHRDLKPGNIKVTPTGHLKVLDFGLAKAFGVQAVGVDATNSPTLSMAATQQGFILGTAAYMSPEQARGRVTDKRTDIWAFGCVLYEMVTGRRLFGGEDTSEILASVIKDQPDWAPVPGRFRRVLEKCLERDPQRRLRDISGVPLLLELEAGHVLPSAAPGLGRSGRVAVGLGVLALVVASLALWRPGDRSPAREAVRFDLPFPDRPSIDSTFELSPDGRHLVISGLGSERRLWVRTLASFEARPLAGTEGGEFPFWSPDSSEVGFFAAGELRKVDLEAGTPRSVVRAGNAFGGGTWSRDGVIVFSESGMLRRVPASGGQALPLEGFPDGLFVAPRFLPDGRRLLVTQISGAVEEQGVYVASIDGGTPVRVLSNAQSAATFEPSSTAAGSGFLLVREGTSLLAYPFDPDTLGLVGEPARLVDGVAVHARFNFYTRSSGSARAMAYMTGGGTGEILAWVDRSGTVQEVASSSAGGDFRLSPDHTRLVMIRAETGLRPDIFTVDLPDGEPQRLTFDPAVDNLPIWAPDGERVVFPSNRGGAFDLYEKAASGEGEERVLVEMGTPTGWATDWSRDGRYILYQRPGSGTGQDLWIAPQVDGESPRPYLDTEFDERDGSFSPDGSWIAYVSNEDGRDDVFVEPFPRTGAKFAISRGGGMAPAWRQDAQELFYVSRDGHLMAVPLTVTASAVRGDTPVPLFAVPLSRYVRRGYEVSQDGQRFLIAMPLEEDEAGDATISIVLNWQAELEP